MIEGTRNSDRSEASSSAKEQRSAIWWRHRSSGTGIRSASRLPYLSSRATKRVAVAVSLVTIVAMLAIAPIAPVGAQSEASVWHVNDDPVLFGPSEWWKDGIPGQGHGSNNYTYTLAIGGDLKADNYAHWYMGDRRGRQEIQVYVPCNHATANVQYDVYVTRGDSATLKSFSLNQQQYCGWESIGHIDSDGADVAIALEDNTATENFRRDGAATSQIGVDAIRMRCTARCGDATAGAPTNLRAIHIQNPSYARGSLQFTWSAPVGTTDSRPTAYKYRISRSGRKWEGTTDALRMTLGNPRFNTRYSIRVSALYGDAQTPAAEVALTTGSSVPTTSDPPVQEPSDGQDRVSQADPADYPYGEGCRKVADKWWMIEGQCTSYVAWRLNDAGMAFHNTRWANGHPTSRLPVRDGVHRWSHAKYWADAARTVGVAVNDTPARGSVAQWKHGWPNTCGAECYGHVAYVEWVSDDGNTVNISEMNYRTGCRMTVRQLERGTPGWPDNFIHFESANP